MENGALSHLSLEFLAEPALVIDTTGHVVLANSAAGRLFGRGLVGRPMAALFGLPEDRLRALLAEAAASTAPVIAALPVPDGGDAGAGAPGAVAPRQVRLARLSGDPAAPALVVLHFAPETEARFRNLRETVRTLESVLRERMTEKAELGIALEQNQLLYRELQHRLKNNIHLIGALLRMSARDHDTPEVRQVLDAAMTRIQAMGRTQEAIYEAQSLGVVEAGAFIERVLRGLSASLLARGRIDWDVSPLQLRADAAHNLALIVNELATNALKYGRQDASAEVNVSLVAPADGTMLALAVADNGPGFDPARVARSSGLALVEALVEQLGGEICHAATAKGTRWEIRLPSAICAAEDELGATADG